MQRPKIYLQISGAVERIVTIRPEKIFLTGPADADNDIFVSVSVIPEKKYPFKIVDAAAQIGQNISVTLGTDSGTKLKEHIITVRNTSKTKGKYSDLITIKTDNSTYKEIKIPVIGNIF